MPPPVTKPVTPSSPTPATNPVTKPLIKPLAKNPAYQVYAIALEFVVYTVVCGLIGWGIDYLAKTDKVWMTVGFIVGILAGGYRFIRQALAAAKQQQTTK